MTTPTLKTWTGEHVKIELYQDGDVLVYQMTGQGIAEQIGTSRMSEADLLDMLLAPMGLVATDDGRIVNSLTSEDLGGLKHLIGIARDAVTDEAEREGWDTAKARRDARDAKHRQAMIAAGFMTENGDPILPDWFSDDLAR